MLCSNGWLRIPMPIPQSGGFPPRGCALWPDHQERTEVLERRHSQDCDNEDRHHFSFPFIFLLWTCSWPLCTTVSGTGWCLISIEWIDGRTAYHSVILEHWTLASSPVLGKESSSNYFSYLSICHLALCPNHLKPSKNSCWLNDQMNWRTNLIRQKRFNWFCFWDKSQIFPLPFTCSAPPCSGPQDPCSIFLPSFFFFF